MSISVSRLCAAGLVQDTGDRTTGRGRVGHYYALADDLGAALAVPDALAGLDLGPVLVDNDVNWAARAERHLGGPGLEDYAYLYLDEGIGCTVVSGGQVMRGHGGPAGELEHMVTRGPGNRAMQVCDVFADLGVCLPGSTAIDAVGLVDALTGPRARDVLPAVVDAVGGILAALVAVADPEVVVVAGRWGGLPEVRDALAAAEARRPRPVEVRAAAGTDEPFLAGVRRHVLEALQAAVAGSWAR